MYYVYILQSQKDEGYYIGMSKDVQRRLNIHNSGGVRSTKFRRPFILLYTERYSTRKEAREREKFLKSYRGSKEKMTIIEKVR
jgi:putative endonuclease